MECIRNNPVSFHIYGRPPIPPTIAHFFLEQMKEEEETEAAEARYARSKRDFSGELETDNETCISDGDERSHTWSASLYICTVYNVIDCAMEQQLRRAVRAHQPEIHWSR